MARGGPAAAPPPGWGASGGPGGGGEHVTPGWLEHVRDPLPSPIASCSGLWVHELLLWGGFPLLRKMGAHPSLAPMGHPGLYGGGGGNTHRAAGSFVVMDGESANTIKEQKGGK